MGVLTQEKKAELRAVYTALPSARIGTYLHQAERNPFAALVLYHHNSQLASALFETVGHFEVHFRSRIDHALSERHTFKKRPGDWLDNKHSELSDRAGDAIAEARQNSVERRRPRPGSVARGHLIAELNLSFWRRLIDARYERIHGSAVMRLYPSLRAAGRTQNDMAPLRALVDPIHALHNRIAHHEPIWREDCVQRRDDMVSLIHQTSPELSGWVRAHSRLDDIIKDGPVQKSTG